jgi:hypothetical protein
MVIRYDDGSYAKGVIQSLNGGRLRIAVSGVAHPVEFRLEAAGWTSASGAVVTLHSTTEMKAFCHAFTEECIDAQHQCAIGGECFVRRSCYAMSEEPS